MPLCLRVFVFFPKTMTTRYQKRFAALKSENRKAFIPYTVLGFPDPDRCRRTLSAMIESCVTALELGIAFSDPVADGPVTQKAAFDVIENGFKVRDALELVREARALDAEIPIGLFVYHNMVIARGGEEFFRQAAEAGADSILIVDLPPESADELAAAAKRQGIDLIFIISPLTDAERIGRISKLGGGFLYVVSRLGITGAEARYDEQLRDLLERARGATDMPLCVGFGISSPENARKMYDLGADGAISGSRVIELIDRAGDDLETVLKDFFGAMVDEGRR